MMYARRVLSIRTTGGVVARKVSTAICGRRGALFPAAAASVVLDRRLPTTSTHVTAAASFSTKPLIQHDMFCRQCEQTQDHHACVSVGVW